MSDDKQATTFSISKDVIEKFDKFCEERHLIKSSLVEELIEKYIVATKTKEKENE